MSKISGSNSPCFDKNPNCNKSRGSWLREKNETIARVKKGPDIYLIRNFGQNYTFAC
jgi:hypothetical protein